MASSLLTTGESFLLPPSRRSQPPSLRCAAAFPQWELAVPGRSSLRVAAVAQKWEPLKKSAGGVFLPKSAFKFEHCDLMGEVLSVGAAIGKGEPRKKVGVVHAAWTRRSRGELAQRPNRKSWRQRPDMYMRPFLLNVFFSKRFIHAKVVHRGTSKVISVASTNAKDLRNTLPSLIDNDACRTIGQLIAERSKEADVFAMSYEPKKNERIEGKLGIILDTIKENGIIFVDR